jgi:hypothetical protein
MQSINIHLVKEVRIGEVIKMKGQSGDFSTQAISVVNKNGTTTDINLFLLSEDEENV